MLEHNILLSLIKINKYLIIEGFLSSLWALLVHIASPALCSPFSLLPAHRHLKGCKPRPGHRICQLA